MKLHIVTRHPLSYNKSEPWFRILERLSTWRSTIYKYLIPSLFAFTRAFESSARVTTVFVRKKRYATSKWFFFFSQTRSQSSTATSKTRRVSVMTKVGHYQFSNCGIWGWQHKVTVNVTFHPFKRLRKIPERKFEKRVHQIPVINVASSARETFMKKVLWFWTYSRYRVKKFRYPIIDDI